jgi:hypothetical protein
MKTFIADEPLNNPQYRPEPPLYQLPRSGDWITLARICRIIAQMSYAGHDGTPYPARVHVVVETAPSSLLSQPQLPGEAWHSIDCESDEQARKIRDQIAADRNAL